MTSFFAGWINVAGGWRWVMWFGAIIQAVATVIIFFFMEETMYFRNTMEGVKSGDSSNGTTTPDAGTTTPLEKHDNDEKTTIPTTLEGSTTIIRPARSYWKKLQLFIKMPGRPSLKQLFTMMYRPLLIMYYFPNVTWAGL